MVATLRALLSIRSSEAYAVVSRPLPAGPQSRISPDLRSRADFNVAN